MGKVIFDVLTLVGSLGLFLYGMKLMSESLQKVAGEKMRSILAAMTTNPLSRVITGILITSIIQSSSATTVMIVSFVNAGLMNLTQAVGVIMGANIGTTFTAWIISLLGFKSDISVLAIPIIGIAFPLMFLKRRQLRSLGDLLIGFALLFMGLAFLKSSVPDLAENPQILEFLSNYTDLGYISIILFVIIGTILTVVIQSSSATMALTLVMCSEGWIPFELAGAMILGENIGTTITANLAAIVANVSAKRAARAHMLFNIFGVVWVLVLYRPFLNLIAFTTTHVFNMDSPFESFGSVAISLSLFHTFFNVINTLILIWFTPLMVKLVTKMVKSHGEEDEQFRLKYIDLGVMTSAEMSLHQAKSETAVYARRSTKMFGFVRDLFRETNEENFNKILERIEKYEVISDKTEIEIATYLNHISESDLSNESATHLHGLYKIIGEIESISDSNVNIAKTLKRKRSEKAWFSPEMRDKVNALFDLVEQSLNEMCSNLDKDYTKITEIKKAYLLEDEINQMRTNLKEEHIQNLEEKKYSYMSGIIYTDIIGDAEKLGDYVINVSEAILDIKKID